MDDNEINSKFEEVLDDFNLGESKKHLLINSSIDYKNRILYLKEKMVDQIKEINEYKDAKDYIEYLEKCFEIDSQHPDKILKCISSLKIALTNYPLQWVKEFGDQGFAILCIILRKANAFNLDLHFEKIQIETTKCIAKFLCSGILDTLSEDCDIVENILTCIDYEKLHLTKYTLRLLVLLLSSPGIEKDLIDKIREDFTNYNKPGKNESFKIIIEGILVTEDEEIWSYCLECVNIILFIIKEVEERVEIRKVIIKEYGLQNKIETLRKTTSIKKQMETFDRRNIEDELEFQLKSRLTIFNS